MGKIFASAAMVVAMSFAAVPASAAVVDFNSFAGVVVAPSVTTQGYTFAAGFGDLAIKPALFNCTGTCAGNGTANLIYGAPLGTIPFSIPPLTLTAPTPFRLSSFDYAEFIIDPSVNATQLLVVGNLVGGGSLSRLFALDGLIDGDGGAITDFQTATLDALFAGSALTSVTFSGFDAAFAPKGFALDNLSLSLVSAPAVPEPAAWALMIGGFGLVGGAMRRRMRRFALTA
ncbi:PEPxxWA-CTERM sorting domain-containing protein [Sphingomonas sp. 1P06PA]|uniref:PEPxxWA-CTERM sorting domain-containing protein n=1 Tax=Sphingomonas sp. 1P06PA TaxID=554121 RepID=UPI0039A4612B